MQYRSLSRRAAAALALAAAGAAAQPAAPLDDRWRDAFAAFAAADRAHAPQPGGVLFVGSSSIRLWDDLERQFDLAQPIVKRGFGGSRLADCARHVNRLVVPYRPRLVVVYAGDNDLAEGAAPERVLADYRRFVEAVHAALPATRIAFVSIKPSPSRLALLPDIRAANALIADYSRTQAGLDYIDVYSRMLDASGRPRAELFRPDALHLNAAGYALWQQVIAGHLR
ncbi:MAG: SGNH/GDSL hydrolase family protein [Betaproteobacteria bacterium]